MQQTNDNFPGSPEMFYSDEETFNLLRKQGREMKQNTLFTDATYKAAYDLVSPELISWEFYEPYTKKEPPFQPMGLFTFLRTYSRLLPSLNRREKWCEVVLRVVEFSLSLDTVTSKLDKKIEARDLFDGIFNLKCFPAGRTLWVGDKNTAGTKENNFNCSGRLVDSLEAYPEAMYLLMCGAGVGFSVEKKYTQNLPTLLPKVVEHSTYISKEKADRKEYTTISEFVAGSERLSYKEVTKEVLVGKGLLCIEQLNRINTEIVIEVGDSKEGWAGALKAYLYALANSKIWKITFNYDSIRPNGERLKRMGGRASGHEPLQQLFKKIAWLVDNFPEFHPIQWMDIMNFIAEVVVVAGVRRSSLLCLGDLEDEEFVKAKYQLFNYLPGINTGFCYGLKEALANANINPHKISFKDFLSWARNKGFILDIYASDLEEVIEQSPVLRLQDLFYKSTYSDTSFIDIFVEGLLPAIEKKVDIWDSKRIAVVKAFDKLDPQYRYRKSRVMSNNSVALYSKPDSDKMHKLFDYIKDNGEPGLINFETGKERREDFSIVNPCGEVLLVNEATCNLTEEVVAAFVDENGNFDREGFFFYLRLTTRMGSRMTMVDLWHPEWDKVQKRDRLLGVSLTGQVDAWNKTKFTKEEIDELLEEAHRIVREEADAYHKQLSIPLSKLTTLGKPSGSLSTLAGVSSGAHSPYGSTFIRRIRASSNDPIASALRDLGVPVSPENGQGTLEEANTWVFSFAVKTPAEKRAIDEPAIEQLERYKQLMRKYVEHNVSYTVSCREEEWALAADWLLKEDSWNNFVGVSFLPRFDPSEYPGSYPQMPYEVCSEDDYVELESKIPKLTEEEFIALIAKYEQSYEEYDLGSDCVGGACPIR